jgi:hypothetical protein
MWPGAPEELDGVFGESAVPDADIAKMTHENAMRWYSYDPFAVKAKEDSTVGALRRSAAGHDVTIRSFDTGRHAGDPKKGLADLAKQATA